MRSSQSKKNIDQEFISLMKQSRQTLDSIKNPQDSDGNSLFGQSVAAQLNNMDPKKSAQAKILINQVLYNVEYGSVPSTPAYHSPPFSQMNPYMQYQQSHYESPRFTGIAAHNPHLYENTNVRLSSPSSDTSTATFENSLSQYTTLTSDSSSFTNQPTVLPSGN